VIGPNDYVNGIKLLVFVVVKGTGVRLKRKSRRAKSFGARAVFVSTTSPSPVLRLAMAGTFPLSSLAPALNHGDVCICSVAGLSSDGETVMARW